MGEWRTVRLRDICDSVDYGLTARASADPVGPKFLRITDIVGESFDWSTVPFVKATPEQIEKYRIHSGDIVIARTGATTGYSKWISNPPDAVFASYLIRLKVSSDVDSRFVGYLLKSDQFWSYMKGVLGDKSAQPNASATTITDAPLRIPAEKSQQQAIARVLGALDDKIAVNERIADSCDKLAESLLDQLLAEDTEVKEIPLGEIAKINPRTVKPVAGGYLRYIDISCVSAGRIEWPKRLPWDKAPGRARRGVSPGDTIWSTVRPGHRSYALILDKDPEMVVSTGFVVLTPVKVGPAFLYEIVKRDAFVRYLENVAEGSAYPAVRPERFASATIPLPSVHALQRFEDAVMPLRCRAHAANQESRTLAQLRDTLLPKLMSGELRVRDAEKAVEESL
ncbi:Type I restriction-modification system [Carbonactinospora thermoautotrophica]|uniref:Type I restriction-modification system n=1 Tax=Carbonactinospora thermoautotrophica TaxID=1469144 RepID=A0A132MML1_9ACTN|nr:restriction endonuclease subunit S [Carbonactinospora thermoautotrophica]KWW98661.1 Type I restriction-modification system [Carbonactinospora thermoautotrophica]